MEDKKLRLYNKETLLNLSFNMHSINTELDQIHWSFA